MNVERKPAAVAVACHRSLERRSLGVWVWPAQRRSVAGVEADPATVWDRAVLPRSLGRVCAAAGSGAILPWQTATVHASTSSARTENSHRPRPDPFALSPTSLLRTGLSKGELFPGAACMPPRKLHRGCVLSTPLPIVFGTRYAGTTLGSFSLREKVRMRGRKKGISYWVPSPLPSPGGRGNSAQHYA